jgi:hypothetical protein
MHEHPRTLNADDLPGLKELAREVRDSRQSVRIVEDGEDLAVLQPARQRRRTTLRGKPITDSDPYWNLFGIGRSTGPGDISVNKRKHLIKAISPRR